MYVRVCVSVTFCLSPTHGMFVPLKMCIPLLQDGCLSASYGKERSEPLCACDG